MKTNRQTPGQGLVEFALILPLILLIIIVFIELGRIIYFYSALNNAVREGARYVIVTQFSDSAERDLETREKVVHYAVALPLDPNDILVYCDRDPTNLLGNPCDDYVTVSADIEIEPMITLFAQMIGTDDTFNINAKSTMQMTPYGNYVE
jgi:Flp pilus assembly protein TadG